MISAACVISMWTNDNDMMHYVFVFSQNSSTSVGLLPHDDEYPLIFLLKCVAFFPCLYANRIDLSPPSVAYIGSALDQIMACRLFGTKQISKPMLGYCQRDA